MLFNSFQFLLVFLPVALTIYAIADRFASSLRLIVLVILSGAFYAYWDWRFLPLLIGSVLINWMCARLFRRLEIGAILVAAMAANLAVLGWFKYEGFLVRSINGLVGTDLPVLELGLPLGISFFTFHHVMYLADVRAGRAPFYGMTRYALYIGFFPQVLAGPLVRWSEIMHQFGARAYAAGWENKAALGVILLVIGLAKKVWLGDPLGSVTNPVFESVASGASPGLLEAWQGALGFTFQIYFDFSGYTDMALGIALLFGIELPQNFDSPYKASSLQAFWRRWHMTLSRFLRDYLYIPLGGNRGGLAQAVLRAVRDNGVRRALARRGLDIRPLGDRAWTGPGGLCRLAANRARRSNSARLAGHVSFRRLRMGPVPLGRVPAGDHPVSRHDGDERMGDEPRWNAHRRGRGHRPPRAELDLARRQVAAQALGSVPGCGRIRGIAAHDRRQGKL